MWSGIVKCTLKCYRVIINTVAIPSLTALKARVYLDRWTDNNNTGLESGQIVTVGDNDLVIYTINVQTQIVVLKDRETQALTEQSVEFCLNHIFDPMSDSGDEESDAMDIF